MPDPKVYPHVTLSCSLETKAAFSAIAAEGSMTQAELFRRMVETLAGVDLPVRVKPDRTVTRRVEVRLASDERDTIAVLAKADGRSIASWIRVVARKAALKAPAFNATELAAFRNALNDLRRIGTNLNQLVHYMHRTDRPEAALAAVDEVRSTLIAIRNEQRNIIDRASNRYEVDE